MIAVLLLVLLASAIEGAGRRVSTNRSHRRRRHRGQKVSRGGSDRRPQRPHHLSQGVRKPLPRSPAPEPMTEDTIFDLASLTKVLATAPAVMQLYEQGRFRLNDPVAEYLPEFAANGKQDITIRQLLTHYSGLPPDVSLDDPWEGKARGIAPRLCGHAGNRSRSAIPLQRHQLHRARRAGREALRPHPRSISAAIPCPAAGCGAHAISSSGKLAQPHCAHPVRSWRHAPGSGP